MTSSQHDLTIVAQLKDLLSSALRTLDTGLGATEASVAGLNEQVKALEASQAAASRGITNLAMSLAGIDRAADNALLGLDAFGKAERLVAAEADNGILSVRRFKAALDEAKASLAVMNTQGVGSFRVGKALDDNEQGNLRRQFDAAKVLFGRDLEAEAEAIRQQKEALQTLDPELRKILQSEKELGEAIKRASAEEKAAFDKFIADERAKRAEIEATARAREQAARFVQGPDVTRQKDDAIATANAKKLLGDATFKQLEAERLLQQEIKQASVTERQAFEQFITNKQRENAEIERQIKLEKEAAAAAKVRMADLRQSLRTQNQLARAALEGRVGELQMGGVSNTEIARGLQARLFRGELGAGEKQVFKNVQADAWMESSRAMSAFGRTGAQVFANLKVGAAGFVKELNSGFGLLDTTAVKILGVFLVLNKLREATQQALEFSRSMSQVASIVDKTDAEVVALGEDVKRLALQFGTNEIDVAKGLYFTLSSGIEDTRDAVSLLEQANKLAVAGFADVETVIDLLTSTINAYGLSVKDASRLNDVFFSTVKLGKAELPELAHNLGAVLPIASQMGVSIEELNAAIAALTLGGQNADEAVTSIRQLLINLLNPTTNAEKIIGELQRKTDAFGDAGLAAAVKSKGLVNVLGALGKQLGGNQLALREIVPDARGMTAAFALSGNQLDEFTEILRQVETATGTTDKALGRVMASQAQRAKILQTGIRQGFLGLGEEVLRAFVPIDGTLESSTQAALALKSAIESLRGPISVMVEGFRAMMLPLQGIRALQADFKARIESDFGDPIEARRLQGISDLELLRTQGMAMADVAEAAKRLTGNQRDAEKKAREWADAIIAQEKAASRLADGLRRDEETYRSMALAAGKSAEEIEKAVASDRVWVQLRKNIEDAQAKIKGDTASMAYWHGLSGAIGTVNTLLGEARDRADGTTQAVQVNSASVANAIVEYEDMATVIDRAKDALAALQRQADIAEMGDQALVARIPDGWSREIEEARAKIRALAREYDLAKQKAQVDLLEGGFGVPGTDAARDEFAKTLAARRNLVDAQTGELQRSINATFSEAYWSAVLQGARKLSDQIAEGDARAARSSDLLQNARQLLADTERERLTLELASLETQMLKNEADAKAKKISEESLAAFKNAAAVREQEIRHKIKLLDIEERRQRAQASLGPAGAGVAAGLAAAQFVGGAALADAGIKDAQEFLSQRRLATAQQEMIALEDQYEQHRKNLEIAKLMAPLYAGRADEALRELDVQRAIVMEEQRKNVILEERERENKKRGAAGGLAESIALATDELSDFYQVGLQLGDSGLSALTNAFGDIIRQSKSAKDAFKDFALSVLGDIAQMIARFMALNAIAALFGKQGVSFGSFLSSLFGSTAGSGLGAGVQGPPAPSAKGNVFNDGRMIREYGRGGVPDLGNTPALFRTADGGLNSMREGGRPEGILPLQRMSNGDLGVRASGGSSGAASYSVSLTINSSSMDPQGAAQAVQRIIPQVEAAIVRGLSKGTNRTLINAVRGAASSS